MFHDSLKTALLLVLFGLMGLSACKTDQRAKPIPPEVNSYVYAYTSGTISRAAPIRLQFTQPVANPSTIGSDLPKGILSVTPSFAGKARWEDDRTILLEPDEVLQTNQRYLVKVRLDKLFEGLPKAASSFEFDFKTREQNFQVRNGHLEPSVEGALENQQYRAAVYTADVADGEDVEKMLTASMGGRELPLQWTHKGDGMTHEFVVSGITRNQSDQEFQLKWDGRPLGVSQKDERIVAVPSLSNFRVMEARVVQEKDQYVVLFFSDPLSKGQNLNGLLGISGFDGSLDYAIEGNQVRIYPSKRVAGDRTIRVAKGVRNINQLGMKNPSEWTLSFVEAKPEVRLVGTGVILPDADGLILPFEAINLHAVDVEVFKIFNNNILQFLQSNRLDGDSYMERVGRIVAQRRVSLQSLNPQASAAEWTRYALDLKDMLADDPTAIYQIRMGFQQSYTNYYCSGQSKDDKNELTLAESAFDPSGDIKSIMDIGYYGRGGYYEGYRWEHRDDPCYSAYYNRDRIVSRNVLASNIGITAKGSDSKNYLVAVTDIRTTDPMSDVELDVYDYQQQLLKNIRTDGDGIARFETERPPFAIIARKGLDKGYLRMADGNALSTSKFDVAGSRAQKGLKGFLYGERGVWRPGDSIYLNFVLEDKTASLPSDHPITFEVYDARNQLFLKEVSSTNVNRIYPLAFATSMDDATGNWRAKVQLGGASFSKRIKVETVKPNRLKIKLDLDPAKAIAVNDLPKSTQLQVNWLHGAPARNLKAKVEVQVKEGSTTFPKYKEYRFTDPARKYNSRTKTIFDGSVDGNGQAPFNLKLARNDNNMPGKMRVNFRTRAFEKGGGYSEDNFSVGYNPFASYAGISIPKNRYGSKRMDIGKEGTVGLVLVDEDGKPLANRKLSLGLYRVSWRWWWERSNNNVSSFNSSNHYKASSKGSVNTNSRGEAKWAVKVDGWGRYMVRVCDETTGHCSGDFFYAGYPWYDSDDNSARNREAAAMLVFSSDKQQYNTGEKVKLRIPTSDIGRALITIENGSQVLESYWKECKKGETNFEFYATPEMAPTVYAHVSLFQPHSQVKNDLPIRMYGVIPIHVEDPKTRLQPKLKMADVLEPEQTVKLEVSETEGRPMAYTIAMVDEGLLDLTRFKTPDPWNAFYAREALGVRTWDVYDHVLGAYGGQMDRLLSIGGDGANAAGDANSRANRFEPVVRHLGPFFLEKGKKASHEITLPNYVGSVRTMVVAADNGAYGKAEKTTAVRKPLMVLATLPRVLGPAEQLSMPINVFAMEDKVKEVTVKVEESSGLIDFPSGTQKSIRFARPGEEMVEFDLKVRESVGVARFKITVSGGGETASQDIEIDVRNPNPYVSDILAGVIDGGTVWEKDFSPIGVAGTNQATLEVSSIPPLNLDKRLRYLLRYPHGCIEQTTSSVFPQLYVNRLLDLDQDKKDQMDRNIRAGIDRIRKFQNASGGFGYWPGDDGSSHWGSNYAGHFLLEAKQLGYNVPDNLLDNWKRFQKRVAKRWDPDLEDRPYYSRSGMELTQAYRLYTLALAGAAELGAMNHLRESGKLNSSTRFRLAAAYALAGQKEIAVKLIENVSTTVKDYRELGHTYGSGARDQAMILETLLVLGDRKKAAELAKNLSERMAKDSWYSTQTTAYTLMAIGKLVGDSETGNKLDFAYQINGQTAVNAGSSKPIFLVDIPMKNLVSQSIKITNRGGNLLYARIVNSGQPLVGDQSAASNHLKVAVSYKKTDGKPLDPSSIQQGMDFIAEVSIINPGTKSNWYEEMALSQVFPSGWEILNTRMSGVQNFKEASRPDYQDIRDDRVYTYFDISNRSSKVFRVQLNAAYRGRYYLPSISCDAMYDNTINARQPGQWVEVIEPGTL